MDDEEKRPRLTDPVSNAQLEKLNLGIRSLQKRGNWERSMPLWNGRAHLGLESENSSDIMHHRGAKR